MAELLSGKHVLLRGCVGLVLLSQLPAARAAEYLRSETTVSPTAHPVKGALDHTFAVAPERPSGFLGSLGEHLSANLRSYDYRQEKENGDENAASVIGGSLGYHSGQWRDLLGFGATVYTSQKLWGPDSKAGTSLLKPVQESFTVLGEVYGELNYESFTGIAGRRAMTLPYINKDDNRQVPNTHESYVFGRRGTGRDFVLGHVTQMKEKDDDSFQSMSDVAGVDGKDKGVTVAGFQFDLPDDFMEAVRRANGRGPRHHMAHSMLIYPDEVERFNFERSNFVTEVSPYQLWVPDPAIRGWFKSLGRDRMDLTFSPLRTIIDAGAVVSYGSDWDNIPEPDPWFALEGMVTRRYPGHPEYGSLNPDERVDVETAIEIFTRNGAMIMEKEDETGTIEVGKSADFIVINQNILEVPVEKIHETKVLRTVLRGKTVYQR